VARDAGGDLHFQDSVQIGTDGIDQCSIHVSSLNPALGFRDSCPDECFGFGSIAPFFIDQAETVEAVRHIRQCKRELFEDLFSGIEITCFDHVESLIPPFDIGYWESASQSEHCQSRVYSTTLCTLSLEVYYKIGGFIESAMEEAPLGTEYEDDVPLDIVGV